MEVNMPARQLDFCFVLGGVEHSEGADRSLRFGLVPPQRVFKHERQLLQVIVACGDEIIGARIEHPDGRRFIAFAGNDDGGRGQIARADVSEQRDAVSVRESQVRQNDVKGLGIWLAQPGYGLALCRDDLQLTLWRVFAQRALHELRKIRVVVDVKNLHSSGERG